MMAHSAPNRTASACAVVFNARGDVLLQRRADDGRWVLPAGAIEAGETAEAAVVREVLEETGCEVRVMRLVGIYSEPAQTTIEYPDGNIVRYVALAFACRLVREGVCEASAAETAETGWFDPVAGLPAGFADKHRLRLADALANQSAAFIR